MTQATAAFAARALMRLAVATATAVLVSASMPPASIAPVDRTEGAVCGPRPQCAPAADTDRGGLAGWTFSPSATMLAQMTQAPATMTAPATAAPTIEPGTPAPVGAATQPPDGSRPRPSAPTDPLPTRPHPTPGPAPTPTRPPDPSLTFAEECTNRLGPAWHALYGPGDPGYAEDADFMGDLRQVSVADGRCRITATRAATPSGAAYASAAMTTKGAFSQRYGTFEVRVRYPAGQGIWPAFVLLRQQAVVTTPPEIDVFEAYPAPPGAGGGSGRNVAVSTLHAANGIHYFVYDHGSDMTTGFHTHRMTWSPGRLVFSIDGVETGRITQDVPDVAMFPVLALAVGAPGYRADATTPDTAVMEIDYLRVWER